MGFVHSSIVLHKPVKLLTEALQTLEMGHNID